MAVVDLEYCVPVTVRVDTDRETVMAVVVDDEALGELVDVANPYHDEPVPAADRTAALAVADTVTWPGWQFGW